MSRLRLAARLARRELRARPWRTLLVASLVAVPVAGMIVATTVVRTAPVDGDRSSFGRADMVVDTRGGPDDARTTFDAGSVLPGSTGVDIVRATVRLRTDDGRRLTGHLIAGPLDAPVLDGLVHLLSGRLPTAPDEVALSPSARSDLGVDVGDELVLRNTGTTLRVVGSVVNPRSFRSRLVVQHEISDGVPTPTRHAQTFVDLPGTPTPRQVNDARVDVQNAGFGSFVVQVDRPWERRGEQYTVFSMYVTGALVLLVMGIVIAAAFAVGARRQLFTLGMLAGNGAEPSMLRRVLLVEGALCGVAGFVLGGALAAVVLTAAAPFRSFLLDRVVDGWVVRPIDVVPVAVLAIACALIAAVQPARSASRVSVLHALGGQRPAGPVPAWLVPVGAVSFLGGAALLALAILGAAGDSGSGGGTGGTIASLTAIAGGVAIVLGTTAWTPAIVGRLEPLASRVRGTWRLSARSLARQRARSSGVISSIAAAGALAVGVSAVVLSMSVADADEIEQLPDDVVSVGGFTTEGSVTAPAPLTIARVEALLGGAQRVDVRPLDAYLIDDAPLAMLDGPVVLGTPEVVAFLGAGDDALAALDAGRVVVLGDDGPRLRRLSNSMIGVIDGGSASEWPVPVVYLRGRDAPSWELPNVLVPASVVDDLGIAPSMPERTLLRADGPLGGTERRALRALDEEIADEQAERGGSVFGGAIGWNDPPTSTVVPAQAALVVLALGFTLLVIGIGLGLAAAEGRSERDVLVAVGASPRAMARVAGAKATVMAAVGGVLAVPTAMVPVWVWSRASTPDEAFRVPWLVIVSLCIGVPVVAGVLTSACSAVGGRLRPVRGSSLAADS